MIEYYDKLNWVYCVSLVLDPRHKLQGFQKFEWGENIETRTMEKFKEIYKKYVQNSSSSPKNSLLESKVLQTSDEEDDIDFDAVYVEKKVFSSNSEKELHDYLSSERAHAECNILEWWKLNENSFPRLAKMARDILCVTATSVPVERVFSEGAEVVTKKRCRLDDQNIRYSVCINDWMKCAFKNEICKVVI